MSYVALTDFNNGTTQRNMTLKYDTDTIAQNTSLSCVKFTVQTQTFPVFLPTIIPTFVPPVMTGTNLTTLPYASSNYLMDWTICVKVGSNYSIQPIRWVSQNYSNQSRSYYTNPTRSEITNDNFFWCYNSLHVIDLLDNALNLAITDLSLTAGSIFFGKENGKFNLYVDNTLDIPNLKIYFNKPMARCFNFYFKSDSDMATSDMTYIVLNRKNLVSLGANTYCSVPVINMTSKLFPYSKIVFYSSNLPMDQVRVRGNTYDNRNVKPEIFDFDLIVDDIDSVYDLTSYTSTTDYRQIILNNYVSKFDIYASLRTQDGYEIPILLDPNDSAHITLKFD